MTAPASFAAAYERYSGSNRDMRGALWELCCETFSASHDTSIAKLSDIIGMSDKPDTVGNWATVGRLIDYTEYCVIGDNERTTYSLKDLWDRSDGLSYDHLLRVAKLAKRLEFSPSEALERLYLAVDTGQKAESLERDIEEAHEPQAVLLRRDLKRIGKRLQQNISSLEFRGASNRLVLAFRILERRMAQELARLEAE